jgi:hypothetical protein
VVCRKTGMNFVAVARVTKVLGGPPVHNETALGLEAGGELNGGTINLSRDSGA